MFVVECGAFFVPNCLSLSLYYKYYITLKRPVRDKHSSLFCCTITDEVGKAIDIGKIAML
jgi:hypothetical protein